MCNNQINDLLESSDKLTLELKNSDFNYLYYSKELHIRTVRKVKETIKKLYLN